MMVLISRITAAWVLPDMVDITLAIASGATAYAVWAFVAYHVAVWLRSQEWTIGGGYWVDTPTEPEAVQDTTAVSPQTNRVESIAREPQPVAARRESMPVQVSAVLTALDNDKISPPLSLNKLDQIGISRSQPRPISEAHTVLNWLRSRGIIDGSGNFTGTIPQLRDLPYSADID
jgi:hypothetical protein